MVIIALAFGAFIAWLFGTNGLDGTGYFLLGTLGAGVVLESFAKFGKAGGLGTRPIVRRAIGLFADLLLWLVRFAPLTLFSLDAIENNGRDRTEIFIDPNQSAALVLLKTLSLLVMVFVLPVISHRHLRYWIGRGTRPLRRLMRSLRFGYGGSARFAGMLEEWANPWRPGQVMLGHSLYQPKNMIGAYDDRHVVTIASNRSGKGRAAIIPNLLLWPGSALVIDPKGQNAAVTAARRGAGDGRVRNCMDQKVCIVDPFAVMQGMGVDHPIHQFNPLAEIDILAFDVVEQIGAITDALVVPSEMSNSYWDRSSRALLAGIIAYVLTDESIADDARHLGTVRDLLSRAALPLERMMLNRMCGGIAAEAANTLKTVGPKTAGLIIGSALEHTDWLQSQAMKAALAMSDFSLKELKGKEPVTIYLVLPPDMLDEHGRFLRLFVSMGLKAVAKGVKPRHAVLFLLDEFYALGPLKALATSAGQLAGYGVKLWPIVQNLGQVVEHYRQNWETFMANAGTWQVFAINDETTARYMAQKMGQKVNWRKVNGEWTPAGAAPLRTSDELGHEVGRSSGNLLIFREGEDPFLLKRANYDRTFPYGAYSADPMEPGETHWESFKSFIRDEFTSYQTERHIRKPKTWADIMEDYRKAKLAQEERRAAKRAAKREKEDAD